MGVVCVGGAMGVVCVGGAMGVCKERGRVYKTYLQ